MPDPARVHNSYPHELSGGMAQRVLIAMALINRPELVIADDATNALDVTVQRQVLDLMAGLIRQNRASALMITHELGIVAQYCQRATIVYAGQVYEVADTLRAVRQPAPSLHPEPARDDAPAALGAARAAAAERRARSDGAAAGLLFRASAARWRCRNARSAMPALVEVEPDHWVRCLRYPAARSAAITADQVGARI